MHNLCQATAYKIHIRLLGIVFTLLSGFQEEKENDMWISELQGLFYLPFGQD